MKSYPDVRVTQGALRYMTTPLLWSCHNSTGSDRGVYNESTHRPFEDSLALELW